MAEISYMKQNDLRPVLQIRLLDAKVPVDLTGASAIKFFMSSRKTGLKVQGTMSAADQNVLATRGVVTYEWQAGDTDTVGDFQAEVQVMWPASKPQTFPSDGYFIVRITKELGS